MAGVAAGLALRNAWPDLPGRILVLGTPGEEGGGGKVYMVKEGVFDNVDVAMMAHPTTGSSLLYRHSLARVGLNFTFLGKSTHAAVSPAAGVNALDAMINFGGARTRKRSGVIRYRQRRPHVPDNPPLFLHRFRALRPPYGRVRPGVEYTPSISCYAGSSILDGCNSS